jgi:hypothetical protein
MAVRRDHAGRGGRGLRLQDHRALARPSWRLTASSVPLGQCPRANDALASPGRPDTRCIRTIAAASEQVEICDDDSAAAP